MKQKLITVGNTKVLVIPSHILKQIGDVAMVKIQFEPERKRLIVDFNPQEVVEEVVDLEVYSVAKNLLARYPKAFAELAKK